MKTCLVALVLALGLGSVANAQQHQTGLVCDSSLTIKFEGARYGDWIQLTDYSGDEERPFLHPDEQNLQLRSGNLRFSITMGSCSRGTGDVLAECHLTRMGSSQWASVSYSFSFERPDSINPAFSEGVTLSRSVEANKLDLVVTKRPAYSSIRKKQTEDAYMHLIVDAVGPTGPVHIDETRRLGEWTSDTDRSNYDRCVFE